MNFHAYVINLEHATRRWDHMRRQLETLQIPFQRIDGIYGDRLQEPVEGYDERRYHILTGKQTNKREIGCYFSHIKALRTFLQSDRSHALILEDDVTLPENIAGILKSACEHETCWDMLRLTSSRQGEYLPFAEISEGYRLAYNLRVLKNTGAYFVNRHAAQCCVDRMLPMCLPFDVALDREWDYGFRTACIVPLPIRLEEEFPGQIPKAKRIRLLRATTFHLFHLRTRLERRFHRRKYYRAASSKAAAN